MLKVLLQASHDITVWSDNFGSTGLLLASRSGHIDMVQAWLDYSSTDIHAKDWHGNNALFAAVRNGHAHITKLLLSKGASTTQLDGFGRDPIWWAQQKGHSEIAHLLLQHNSRIDDANVLDVPSPGNHSALPFDAKVSWCDACLLCIRSSTAYCCKDCVPDDYSKFCLCTGCYALGIRCLNSSHTLELRHDIIGPQ